MTLEISELSKSFKKKIVLEKINYVFTPGIYALLGVNGAGKTTLIKCMLGILKLDGGIVKYNKVNILKDKRNYQCSIGYMSQYATYYDMYSVYEFLDYICAINKIKKAVRVDLIEDILKKVNLYDEKRKKIKNLSGGMRQRLGLAQAIIKNPDIIILDEPTAGLDPNERVRFRDLIRDVSKGKIVLIATHHIDDAKKLADHIVLLHNHSIYNTSEIEKQMGKTSADDFDLEKYFYEVTNGEISDDY